VHREKYRQSTDTDTERQTDIHTLRERVCVYTSIYRHIDVYTVLGVQVKCRKQEATEEEGGVPSHTAADNHHRKEASR
jgi:hypothetical protein